MPVKKKLTPAEMAEEKSKKKKKVSRQERTEIKKAVSSLPSFLIEQVARPSVPIKKPTAKTPAAVSWPAANPSYSRFEQKKRRLLWLVVGAIMIFIVSLWVINLRTEFTDAGFNFGSEEQLWQTAKEDFTTFVKKPVVQAEAAKKSEIPVDPEEIKQVLAENLVTLSVTTTAATSTLEITTSTFSVTSTEH